MMNEKVTSYFRQLSKLLLEVKVSDSHNSELELDTGTGQAVEMVLAVKAKSGKVMVIGNGGSAAIASHMQNDLCQAAGIRAMVFTDASVLTARANDYGYESVYKQPAELWAEPDDLLVAISSSGQSENILQAVKAARSRGSRVITLSGFKDNNPLRSLGDINFYVASSDYGFVETAHSVITHFLTDCAKESRSEKETPRD